MGYLYRNEEDEVLKPKKGADGQLHFPGEVVPVGDSSYRRSLDTLMPLLTAADKTPTIILMPIPKFLNGLGCCTDTAHATNKGSDALKDDACRAVASGKNALNRHLIHEKIWGVKALSAHPTLRSHLTAAADESGSPDLGNYMPLHMYGTVLAEALDLAKFIDEKKGQATNPPSIERTTTPTASQSSSNSAADIHRNQIAWRQRLNSQTNKRSAPKDTDKRRDTLLEPTPRSQRNTRFTPASAQSQAPVPVPPDTRKDTVTERNIERSGQATRPRFACTDIRLQSANNLQVINDNVTQPAPRDRQEGTLDARERVDEKRTANDGGTSGPRHSRSHGSDKKL